MQLIGQVQNPFANITGYLPKYYSMLASAERLMEAEQFEKDGESRMLENQEYALFGLIARWGFHIFERN